MQTGFYRPNLHLAITPAAPDRKLQMLVQRLRTQPRGPTIVYVTHRETAEEVAECLCQAGFPAQSYHAGMKDEDRQAIQEQFMASAASIIVATIAFGMGVDKGNIRYVHHYDLPKSPEGYSQEIGRAGRDGEPSHCELLLCPEDMLTLENIAYGDTPAWTSVAGLVINLFSRPDAELEFSLYELSSQYDIHIPVLKTLLTYLELDGYLFERGPRYKRIVSVALAGFRGLSAHTALMGELFRVRRLAPPGTRSRLTRRPASSWPARGTGHAPVEAQEAGTIELEPRDSRVRYYRIQSSRASSISSWTGSWTPAPAGGPVKSPAYTRYSSLRRTMAARRTCSPPIRRAADGAVQPLPVVQDARTAGHAAQRYQGTGRLHHRCGDRSSGEAPGTAARAVGAGKVPLRYPVAVDHTCRAHVTRAFRRLPNRAVSVGRQRRPPGGRSSFPQGF